ncbi:predicted aconitase subunit 2 [Pyrobaculum islandicum DSM 4184]|uniref:Predicted aconitase subunit 2 n=1 Tax=Pyrobaculum islandicum (strain DSM 4184 / JCM 9189 / GEO3) TaxID=384616 RepID=A1RSU8_PYRIL|nr:predicted aconitase subunit 2 [Pyrobaculum islandicum DSM 4184]
MYMYYLADQRLKPLVKGRGHVSAEIVKLERPVSFLGDLDPKTGVLAGINIVGKILALPYVKGSTVGPYVLWNAAKRGKSPLAIVAEKPDLMLVTACVLAGVPLFEGRVDAKCINIDLETGAYEICK